MSDSAEPPSNPSLVSQLHTVLETLSSNPYPVLTTETTKKRASVALIIRLNPSYSHYPDPSSTTPSTLSDFFFQPWTHHADPEVLFIKRASRKGDRWTSHIALPGGRRDPEDASDQAAAIRETLEEVGLDLNTHALPCGNLPQRLVTTHWGKTPLMTLCPYVFLTTQAPPPLRLQPTEVASTHWVPLRSLLSPSQRTTVGEDVSSRLANQETGVKKWMLSCILGKMTFAAIALAPTESFHSFETPVPEQTPPTRSLFNPFASTPPPPAAPPLLLWGLTLGVIADFLDLLPPHNALTLWTYPTFSPWDVRAAIYLLTYNFKHRKRAELQAGTTVPVEKESGERQQDDSSRRSFGAATESMVIVDPSPSQETPTPENSGQATNETGLHGLGTGVAARENFSKKAAVATMLEGWVDCVARGVLPSIADRGRYYDIVRRAVGVAVLGRLGVVMWLVVIGWRRWGRGRR